ncbi:MAG TPA: flagellar basal body P-ring formation chaperone FlgA [Candidatus Didemnitutus sp.]|nr:flagellar basal body P-ring formation chaperone FlgA [Candidatus Didemnitutus sp.]
MRPAFQKIFTAAIAMAALNTLSVAAATDSKSSPAAAQLTAETLSGDLARDLASHFNLEGDLEVELPHNWIAPAGTAAQWRVEIAEYPMQATGAMVVRCRLIGDGAPVDETSLLIHATLWREAWFARQPFANGATFDPAGLDTRRVDVFRERDIVPASSGDRTFIFIRSVQPGRLLTWRDLGRRPLVRKGDLVEVTANEGMLALNMKGLAMQNGAMGEAVTVRNLDSHKDFTAFVIDDNHVQVRF